LRREDEGGGDAVKDFYVPLLFGEDSKIFLRCSMEVRVGFKKLFRGNPQ